MAKTVSERLEQTREIRDAILDRMSGRITDNHNSYSVGDRSISKMTMGELDEAYSLMDKRVRRLEKEFRRKTGKSTFTKARF